MIAMQYDFTLPADYDMGIIDRRIRDRGSFTDNFPGLLFKAYLTASRTDAEAASGDNHYAPFYVWNATEGLNDFVCGPGFAGVADSFGRPQIRTWIPWHTALSADISAARYATREFAGIAASESLDALRRAESETAATDVADGKALASVVGFDPMGWTRLRFRLWRDVPEAASGTAMQIYRLAHLSLPGGATAPLPTN